MEQERFRYSDKGRKYDRAEKYDPDMYWDEDTPHVHAVRHGELGGDREHRFEIKKRSRSRSKDKNISGYSRMTRMDTRSRSKDRNISRTDANSRIIDRTEPRTEIEKNRSRDKNTRRSRSRDKNTRRSRSRDKIKTRSRSTDISRTSTRTSISNERSISKTEKGSFKSLTAEIYKRSRQAEEERYPRFKTEPKIKEEKITDIFTEKFIELNPRRVSPPGGSHGSAEKRRYMDETRTQRRPGSGSYMRNSSSEGLSPVKKEKKDKSAERMIKKRFEHMSIKKQKRSRSREHHKPKKKKKKKHRDSEKIKVKRYYIFSN